MRLVPVSSVREGTELAKTIFDSQGRILLSKGVELKQGLIRRIRKNGIMSVYINDEYSDNEIEDVIKPELRIKAIKLMKDSYTRFSEMANEGITNKKLANKLKTKCLEDIGAIIESFINELFSQKEILVKMVDIKSMDNYTYQHCVNVAVLSIIVGIEMQYNKEKLTHLATGAILHDLGKTYVPKEVLLKPGKLTSEEFEVIKNHSEKGYEYLKDNMYVSSISRVIALQHHERVDGTGYPRGISGDEINECAKIVAVADVYDALVSDRPYRQALSPNEAIEYIMGASGTHFDYKVAQAFIKMIVPYPEGTLVRLSNGDIAVVTKTNPKFSLRPKVRVVMRNGKAVENSTIDLVDEKNITISGIQYDVES
ncbi:MAG: HD-GYP domain-containing protein [Firmicutes bacterium]|nr:HD-GYP domain-containing protein [Sporosalibacterium faouarense]MTI48999.1 HD-GYP domain-containing protein [Bacillota bacterium]